MLAAALRAGVIPSTSGPGGSLAHLAKCRGQGVVQLSEVILRFTLRFKLVENFNRLNNFNSMKSKKLNNWVLYALAGDD